MGRGIPCTACTAWGHSTMQRLVHQKDFREGLDISHEETFLGKKAELYHVRYLLLSPFCTACWLHEDLMQ